jgi:prevent-host-death family protein
MLDLDRDIHPLTEFKRETSKFIKQLKETGEPVVLTINGKAELVVQDAASYQKLLEAKERIEAIAGIRRGLEEMKRGEGRPAEEVFADLFKEFGISEDEEI